MPQPVVAPVTLIELDFGDADFVVRSFSDGMYAVEVDGEGLLVNEEQFRKIVESFIGVARVRGWLLTFTAQVVEGVSG